MQTWNTSTPATSDWYTASTCEPRVPTFRRYWNGRHWSTPIHCDDVSDPVRLERARTGRGETQDDVVWLAAEH
jgi:hypothetical protein